ncbi:MAG TPA: ion channel [Anaerolineales bacterium]|nr:ion channel [Anaerolineales bacterium]
MKQNELPFRDGTTLSRYHPSAWLLIAQLVLLVLYASFDGSHSERVLISIAGTVILVLVVWVIYRSPAVNWIAWVLSVPALVFSLWTIVSDNSTILMLSSLFESGLYFYAAAGLIAYMMGDYRVTTDELFAAGATYTLLAWGFGYAYLVVEVLVPGSFLGPLNQDRPATFIELLFVSFTNLSATGLSDIVPTSAPARVLIMLEQFAGVGYIAVVISRLVGFMGQRKDIRPH